MADTYGNLKNAGVPMEQALTEDGCQLVRGFLSALLAAHKKYGNVDVRKFMKEYVFNVNGNGLKQRKEIEPKFWTRERVERAIALRKSGMYWKDIGAEFGKPGQSVQYAVVKYRERRCN